MTSRYTNPMDDPYILRSKIEMLERQLVDARTDLELARQHARNYEHQMKALRKEIMALRQGSTTQTIRRRK